ncbi:hypothetical protein K9M50_00355 [Patescibacteria group bacterium]|nr:hypothetical protein [Patescibacteria group bacterium]
MANQDKEKKEKIELIKSYLNDLDLNLKNIIDKSITEMTEISSTVEKEKINKIMNDLKKM